MSESVIERLRVVTERARALPQVGPVEAAIGLPVSEADLFIAVVEAAQEAALLEYDPSYTDAENTEIYRRAVRLRDALAAVTHVAPSPTASEES